MYKRRNKKIDWLIGPLVQRIVVLHTLMTYYNDTLLNGDFPHVMWNVHVVTTRTKRPTQDGQRWDRHRVRSCKVCQHSRRHHVVEVRVGRFAGVDNKQVLCQVRLRRRWIYTRGWSCIRRSRTCSTASHRRRHPSCILILLIHFNNVLLNANIFKKNNNMSAIASAMDPDEYHASCLFMAAMLTQLLIQFRFMMMSYVRRQVEWQEMFEMAEAQYNDNVQSLIESHAREIQLIRGSWLLQHEGMRYFGRQNHPYRSYSMSAI